MTNEHAIRTYARLIEMMSNGDAKWVDKSEFVPPSFFWEQEEKGQLDRETLVEELGTISEMIVDFACDLAEEAVEHLSKEVNA